MTSTTIVVTILGVIIAGLLSWVGSLSVNYLKAIKEGVTDMRAEMMASTTAIRAETKESLKIANERMDRIEIKKAEKEMVVDCQSGCSREFTHAFGRIEKLEAKS